MAAALLALVMSVEGKQPPEHHGATHDEHSSPSSEHGMHHDFGDVERYVERFEGADRQAWQMPASVVEMMEIEPGMAVVDLGAGTGYFLPHLSAAVGEEGSVLALDVEDNMLAYMRERVKREHLRNVVVRRVPADGPGLSEASVDRLLIVNTWHHLDHRKLYATKIARALKPGGRLYVVDFDVDSPLGPPVKHRLDPARVVAEVEGGGLEVETVTETLLNQFVVVGCKVGSARRGEER
jgi:ubiquinone/menaquinone biosynthesis C-methylase UbiE